MRKNITQPSEWWDAFESRAISLGKSLSEWAGDCMKAGLTKKVRDKLPPRPAPGPRKKNKGDGK